MARPSAVDIVINRIKEWISEGAYKSGDKLPPEGDICKVCSVSRGSVREAVKVLSAVGLIEVKRGDGTYISKDEVGEDVLNPLQLSFQKTTWNKEELAEFRGAIEHSIVELIIKKATGEEIEELKAANNFLREAVEKMLPIKDQVTLDMAFHKKMGSITHNKLISILYSNVLEFFFKDTERLYLENVEMGRLSVRLHDAMLDSLSKRNLKKAISEVDLAMENHVASLSSQMEKIEKTL